jgi:replicative DNA helicase
LQDRGELIDRVTSPMVKFANSGVWGLSYLVTLDDLHIPNVDSYIRVVKDKALLRRIIFASQGMISRCMLAEEEPGAILAAAEEQMLKLGEERVKAGLMNAEHILSEYEGGINAFLDPSKRIKVSRRVSQTGRDDRRPAWRRLVHCSGPAVDGEDGVGVEHRAARRVENEADGRHLPSNVQCPTRMVCAARRTAEVSGGLSDTGGTQKLNHALHDWQSPCIDDTAGIHLMDACCGGCRRSEGSRAGDRRYLQLMSARSVRESEPGGQRCRGA